MNQDGLDEQHPGINSTELRDLLALCWGPELLVLFIILFVWETKVLFTRAEKRNRNEVGKLR